MNAAPRRPTAAGRRPRSPPPQLTAAAATGILVAMSSELTCAFLRECAGRFDDGRGRFEALVATLGEEAASWKPGARRWSVAECLGHIVISARLYFPSMEEAIRKGRERGSTGSAPYRRGTWAGRLLIRLVDPQSGTIKLKAPGLFRPAATELDIATLYEDFRAVQDRFAELMELAEGLPLGQLRLATPVSVLVRLSLAQTFDLHSRHQLRHLEQAEAVVAAADFPVP